VFGFALDRKEAHFNISAHIVVLSIVNNGYSKLHNPISLITAGCLMESNWGDHSLDTTADEKAEKKLDIAAGRHLARTFHQDHGSWRRRQPASLTRWTSPRLI